MEVEGLDSLFSIVLLLFGSECILNEKLLVLGCCDKNVTSCDETIKFEKLLLREKRNVVKLKITNRKNL